MRWILCVALFVLVVIFGMLGWSAQPEETGLRLVGYGGGVVALIGALWSLSWASQGRPQPKRVWSSDHRKPLDLGGNGPSIDPDAPVGAPVSGPGPQDGAKERKVYEI